MSNHSHPHEMKVYGEIKLFAGDGSPELAKKISAYLGSPLCERELIEFPNENHIYKTQPKCPRTGCIPDPADGFAGQPQLDRVVDHPSNAAVGFSSPHHRGDSLSRLRTFR